MDIRAVARRGHPGRAATVCGLVVRAHHSAHGDSQLCEFLFLRAVFGCLSLLFPVVHSVICACALLSPVLLQVFLPGNNCTAITNGTEVEGLKLYTVPVRSLKSSNHVLVSFAMKQELSSTSINVFKKPLYSLF